MKPADIDGPTNVHQQVTALSPTQLRKSLRQLGEAGLSFEIVFVPIHQHGDAPHALTLLPTGREWPRRRAEPRNKFAPPHP
jgi:hypothetical protein